MLYFLEEYPSSTSQMKCPKALLEILGMPVVEILQKENNMVRIFALHICNIFILVNPVQELVVHPHTYTYTYTNIYIYML